MICLSFLSEKPYSNRYRGGVRNMDHHEIITHYKKTFKRDPLYSRIELEGLTTSLFDDSETDYFSKVNFTDTYKSKHAAQLLNIEGKEQTLVNYLNRNDLNPYLNVYRQGRLYRYDWQSLFKFKMIILLTNHGFTPLEIAAFVGSRLETTTIDPGGFKPENEPEPIPTNQDFYKISKNFADENFKKMLLVLKSIEEFKELLHSLETEKTLKKLDLKLNDERRWSIQGRLDDLEGYMGFMKVAKPHTEAGGVFSWLFKKKDTGSRSRQESFDDSLSSFDEKKKKLNDSLNLITDEKKQILSDIKQLEEKIQSTKQQSNQLQSQQLEKQLKNERADSNVLSREIIDNE